MAAAGGRVEGRLKRWFTLFAGVWLVTAGAAAEVPVHRSQSATDALARRVIILANESDPDSLRIARHYAAERHVPDANIIALPMSTAETITWSEFVPSLWEPLMARLVRENWIDAIPMDLRDAVGRRKYAVHGHRIAALVVCRGVPLRIAHDPALYVDALPFTSRPEFRTNAAAVDGELGLLSAPNHPINAFVLNPLFQNDHPRDDEKQQVVKVSRLDGPTAADAMALVDHAIEAERDGLLGRAYVDLSDRDPIGNRWLEAVAAKAADLGFETDVDRAPATMPATARFDAPVLYFGWYAGDLDGPFTLPGFRFPPGAIALHIHSYSASTVRSTTAGWVGPFVARGVTATLGNVYEPYLQLTHRPNLLLNALARGDDLVDAAYYSLQALSWQEVLIGDPLYRPFAVPLSAQLRRLAELNPSLAGYAVMREANRLAAAGRNAAAVAALRSEFQARPSLPVALTLADRLRHTGDGAGAAAVLAALPVPVGPPPGDWFLVRTVADQLAAAGHAERSIAWWRTLLDERSVPRELRLAWLPEAVADARAAAATAQLEAWQQDLDEAKAAP
ncbi:MAG TPA: TIGR03790 family protein [Opitutaceae bacterium]|nr:TIGR03790 family protein [Opitutaceae bacterium]